MLGGDPIGPISDYEEFSTHEPLRGVKLPTLRTFQPHERLLRVELPTLAGFQLCLPFDWVSVAMHELPLPVLAAVDLCHS